jgi:hypothetical protein
MSNGSYAGTVRVGLSNTAVFPRGTQMVITPSGSGYSMAVTNAGSCGPEPSTLTAMVSGSMLVSQQFVSACDPTGPKFTATMAKIGGRFRAGEVAQVLTASAAAQAPAARRSKEDDGDPPAGTYTAEEEGGGEIKP